MATIMPAWSQVHPSFVEPELLIQINQFSGAFDTLAEGKPRVKLGEGDLAVYIRRIDLRTRVAAGQTAYNQLPSCDIVGSTINTPTYLQRVRAEYDHHDTAAAANYNVSIVDAHRLAMRQGHFQLMRDALLFGMNPTNGEGLLNATGATTVNLPPDSFGNTTVVTYDNGQMAFWLLGQVQSLKTSTYQLGAGRTIVILGPQRALAQWEYSGIVQLTQYQRTGAGTASTAGLFKEVLLANGDKVIWCYDDTLQGKGPNGADVVLMVMPEVGQPTGAIPNTNEFGKLPNGMYMNTLMYTDMAAPREIPTPLAGGAIDVLSEIRISSGWAVRPEGVRILYMLYQ